MKRDIIKSHFGRAIARGNVRLVKEPNRLPNKSIIVFIYFSCVINVYAQLRTFNEIFPNINEDIRIEILSNSGYVRSSQRTNGFMLLGSQRNTGIDPQIINIVLNKNPGYIVESITVVSKNSGTVNLLDVYNALGNVRGLKGRLYNSSTRGQAVPLFEDATRIVSERQTTTIPDPVPARVLPQAETIFIRLRDVNFGNTYYRGDMALVQNGLRYTLSNFRNISYLFIPVIRADKFIAQLYFEPIHEGVLIYSIAGVDISDFVASQLDVHSAIAKRLAVITSWAADGIINGY
ncbi:MAG: hypothetical protein LBQ89_06365 [Treponema sp.]|jgi:hypothetical protein|nr:hypothetical protein [Treponema sp.]